MLRPRLLRLLILASLIILSACAGQRFGEIANDDFPLVNTRGENTLLNTAQIQLLFSDVTAYGWRLTDNSELKRYYSGDGRVIDLHPIKGRHEGRWRAVDNQLCTSRDEQHECAVIKRENNRITQYLETTTGKLRKSIDYERFLRGNPEQLE
jgi:hypothetical protein